MKSAKFKSIVVFIVCALTLLFACACDGKQDEGKTDMVKPTEAEIFSALKNNVVEITANNQTGTGFIYSKASDGDVYVVTCFHLTGYDPSQVFFEFGGEKTVCGTENVQTVGYDRQMDLAVFKVKYDGACRDMSRLKPYGLSGNTAIGEKVLAIGSVDGKGVGAYDGIISYNDDVELLSGYYKPLLRISAAINPGMSGAPVVDSSGNLVGMALGRNRGTSESPRENMGYLLPEKILSSLVKKAIANPKNDDISRKKFDVSPSTININQLRMACLFKFTDGIEFTYYNGAIYDGAERKYDKINGLSVPVNNVDMFALLLSLDADEELVLSEAIKTEE